MVVKVSFDDARKSGFIKLKPVKGQPKSKPKPKPVKAKAPPEPTWLIHFHYGKGGLPFTIYDNHDGTFTYGDNRYWLKNIGGDEALRVFTKRMDELIRQRKNLQP